MTIKQGSIKRQILLSLFIAMVVALGAFFATTYWSYQKELSRDLAHNLKDVEEIIKEEIEREVEHMDSLIEIIARDEQLVSLFRKRDRNALLEKLEPTFKHISAEHHITHFYLSDAKRQIILRVHNPGRYGDIVDRITTLKAEETGKTSFGLELGPLGTFTLRTVFPWHDAEGNLLGYIELGEEFGHSAEELHHMLNLEICILIDKKFLNRRDWEEGMQMLGRADGWDTFTSSVVAYRTTKLLPKTIAEIYARQIPDKADPYNIGMRLNGKHYRAVFIPLTDAAQREIGQMVFLYDITPLVLNTRKSLFFLSGIYLLIGGIIFASFYILLGRIEEQLASARTKLVEESRRREEIQRQRVEELQRIDRELEKKVSARTQELAQVNESLQGEVTQRMRAQERQKAITLGLRTVMEIADELIACPNVDSLFKMAVERARDRLGLERCAIFVEENGYMRGTYGTDRSGHTTDEHGQRFPKNESWSKYSQFLQPQEPKWFVVEEPHLEWNGQETVQIGSGWIAVTPMQSAQHSIGVFVNDTAISKQALDTIKQEMAAVFCSLLGNITERKRAEEALSEEKSFLVNMFESIQDGISILDNNMNIISVNSAMERWYAHAMPLVGKKCYEAYHCAKQPCVVCPTQKTLKTGESAYDVVPKRGAGGEIIGWLDLFSFPLRNTYTGEIEGAIEYVRDITARKQQEEALRTNEQQYRTIITTALDGFWIVDTQGHFLDVNDAYCRLTGYSRNELLSMSIQDIEAVETSEETVQRIHKIIKTGGDRFESRHRCKDARIVDIDISVNYIEIMGTGKLFVFIRDITERKETEREREKLNKEILRTNERLRQLALRDSHTGLYNHRYLTEIIEAEFDRDKRYSNPLSVIMLDIDYFKSINDVYGHPFGDLVLRQFARQLKRMVRRYDTVVRFGGEEFIIVSPGTDRSTAMILAQRILDAVNLYNFGNKEHTIKLKLSLAVASYPEDVVVKGMDLIELTDQILNKVKEYGGNRVYSSTDIKRQKTTVLEKGKELGEVKILKEKLEKLTKRANQSLIEAIFAFAKTIELKDHYTGEHVEKTSFYATEIARALSLPKDEIERVRQASILHDLGKIGISEKILLKKEQLTDEELGEVKKHPQIGVDVIRPIQFLHAIIPFILYHHERWDGKGYPGSLRGEEIPVGARILAIADVYQALISDRPYRQAYPKEEAIKIIKTGAGSQFDPTIVNIFLEILRQEK